MGDLPSTHTIMDEFARAYVLALSRTTCSPLPLNLQNDISWPVVGQFGSRGGGHTTTDRQFCNTDLAYETPNHSRF